MKKAVIFDIDGVLAEKSPSVVMKNMIKLIWINLLFIHLT